MEYLCQNVLARRHGGWGRRGLADSDYRAGQHHKVTEGEVVVEAVGRYEEGVAKWSHGHASAACDNPVVAFWVPDPDRPSL